MAALFCAGLFAFLIGLFAMRRLRTSLSEDASLPAPAPLTGSFPLQTYHAVIQQLKQQKHELQSEQQAERRRAKTSENIAAAVLSNLPCGVLFFTSNGLLRQSNGAARRILGLASPTGMSIAEVFRAASLLDSGSGDAGLLSARLESSLRAKPSPELFEVRYLSPGAEERALEVT